MGSSPGFVKGQIPSAELWNASFAAKQDDLGFTPTLTIASVAAIRASDLSGIPSFTLVGYYGAGTPGGGTLAYAQDAGADNGGAIIWDIVGNPFVRINYTGSVYEWGAKADAVQITHSGTITTGQKIFRGFSAFGASDVGKRIAIVGAGASQGTLASTIVSVDQSDAHNVTLADNAVYSTPTYLPIPGGAVVVTAGAGYAVADKYLMSDGTTLGISSVNTDTSVDSFVILSQGATQTSIPGSPLTQISSPSGGLGMGLTCTLNYAGSGQYSYGTDDGAAINAAIVFNSTADQPVDTLLPSNAICGTSVPVAISSGKGHVRGTDMNYSGIVLLAAADRAFWRDATGGFGGGAHLFFVDAYGLAPVATEQANGRGFTWEKISSRNATQYFHWAHGIGTDANGGTNYVFTETRYVFNTFARTDTCGRIGYFIDVSGGPCQMWGIGVNSVYTSDHDANPSSCIYIGNPGVHITQTNIFGGPPYSPTFGVDVNKPCQLYGVQVGGPIYAAVHINSGEVLCVGAFAQWGRGNLLDPAISHGVLIESTTHGISSTNEVQVYGTYTDPGVLPENIVTQLGMAGNGTIVQNNALASYSWPPVKLGASGSIWAQPITNNFAAAAQNLGGLPFGNTLFDQYDTLLSTLGPALLAKLGMFYIFTAIDEITASINILNPSGPTILAVNDPPFTAFRGYTGDGIAAYLTTQILSQNIPNFALDNASVLCWFGDNLSVDNSFIVGTNGGGKLRLNPRAVNGNAAARFQTGSGVIVTPMTAGPGMVGMVRRNTANVQFYFDGAPTGAAVASLATSNFSGEVGFLSDGWDDSVAHFYSGRTIQAAILGTGATLSDADILATYNAMKTFLQAIGAPTS